MAMANLRGRAVAIACVAATGAAGLAVTPAQGESRADTRAYSLRASRLPVIGVTGVAASVRARLSFPVTWRVTSLRANRITLREGSRGCTYTVVGRNRVVVGPEADAAAHVAAVAPARGPYVLDAGTRGTTAWRVIRIREPQRVHLESVRAAPVGPATKRLLNVPADRNLWLETRISAISGRGDECHSGTYREVAGPAIGDALATARTRVTAALPSG
jgi:hypothetical protein